MAKPKASTKRITDRARVVALHGKEAHILTHDGRRLVAIVRGKFKQGKRQQRSPLAVGDWVSIEELGPEEARLTEIHDRDKVLSRPSAHNQRIEQIVCTNVDQVVITLGAANLAEELPLLDRLLVAVASSELEIVIAVNKIDLVDETYWQGLMKPYESLDWPILGISAAKGQGLEALKGVLKDRTSVFAGMSGVGKSTTLNALQPGLELRTSAVNEKSGEGRHTTTNVSLLPLDFGGFVVDTPGVREFGLWRIDKRELALWYPDYAALLGNCRYKGCTHTHEPGCAIKGAVEAGELDQGRYARYLVILDEIQDETH